MHFQFPNFLPVLGLFIGVVVVAENEDSIDQDDQKYQPSQIEPGTLNEYMLQRNALLQNPNTFFGGDLTLDSKKEIPIYTILMNYKEKEFAEGLDASNGLHFASAQHFFHAKEKIEASNVYKMIKQYPKGCALHLHDSTTGSVDWIVKNLTRWQNLYMCVRVDTENQLIFRFANQKPSTSCNPSGNSSWMSVQDFRNNASSEGYVDELFFEAMSLYTQTPELMYKTNNEAWHFFGQKIETVFGIVGFVDAMNAYYYETLQEFYDDNVMYVENRGLLEYIYRLDQSQLTPSETLAEYQTTTEKFVQKNPDFWGAKFIITPIRFYSQQKMGEMVDTAIKLERNFPNFFAGFDIVAHEDVGTPNIDYMPDLLRGSNAGLKFFFHAGESDWHGTKIDDNILDAILLNTTRIGHGTALNGRPYLTELVKKRKIVVEVSPISSQVLHLGGVDDFRTHPAIPWLRKGFPIVIASDNPGMWKATGLSYDWYIAFMGLGGKRSDLNSTEKKLAKKRWNNQYNVFLDKIIASCGVKTNDCTFL